MTAVTDQPEPANSAGGHSADGAVLIIGAGLIGTSLGLALRQAGRTVYLSDRQTEIAVAAATLGAGTVYPAQPMPDPAELEADPAGLGPDSGESAAAPSPIELVVVAVQPDQVAAEVAAALLRFPDATVTDVSSVKGSVLAELIERGSDIRRYVGSHPMAGSQRSGPLAARADLFRDRTWVIAIHEHEDYARTALVEAVAKTCGSRVVIMPARDHDVAVAQVSHLPQLVSSLLAGRLNAIPYQHLSLAGQGLRDMTRVAASDPALWSQIIALNRAAVQAELEQLAADLTDLIAHLDSPMAVHRVIARGRQGITGLPGKHGHDQTTVWEPVVVELSDRPGALAEIFKVASQVGVNVEDLRIEHDPVREVGDLTILVADPAAAARLATALVAADWQLRA